MAWQRQRSTRFSRRLVVWSFGVAVFLTLVAAVAWLVINRQETTVDTTPISSSQNTTHSSDEPEEVLIDFDTAALQDVVDTWDAGFSGTASVVISDTSGEVLASLNPDEIYFAASLYKLYVAYAGYQSIDDGSYGIDKGIILNKTRGECLDLMIRNSDSPCGEAWWVELGKPELTEKMSNLGLGFTNMSAITTSASDAAKILALVARGEGLSDESQAAFLDSMETQDDLYRRGLPSGFSDQVTVYNKVGWNENVEWHDAAIVKLSDGRQVIVTVLTKNVGASNIRNLATELEKILQG